MNYMKIEESILNGDGVRTVLWLSGCPHHCEGCHNPETWDSKAGKPFLSSDYEDLLLSVKRTNGRLSILGGEPLAPYNYENLLVILFYLDLEVDNLNVWLWTGYTIEEAIELNGREFLGFVDVVIDGKYEKDNPTTKKYRGSDNQRMWVAGEGYVD